MPVQKLSVEHNGDEHTVDYDTNDGIEVLRYQLYSLTFVPPDSQTIFGDRNIPVKNDADLLHICVGGVNKLKLVEKTESVDPSPKVSLEEITALEKADEELARLLQAEEDALVFQQVNADLGKEVFEGRLRPQMGQVLLYEDPVQQEAARKSVPMDELEEKAAIALAKDGKFKPDKVEKDHALLLQLLFWFKQSFRWVNQPPCSRCGFDTVFIGNGNPTAEDLRFGGNRVELYRCKKCPETTRFPRYNDPVKLVETRRGRCGEWANCFTLYCRAFGYQARLVLDFTDHLWTECFSDHLGRWMHLDPCEGAFDQPLLYEQGWDKKLTYAIALAKDGVYDVTKRYTRKWPEILRRRLITSEANVQEVISSLTKEARRHISSNERASLENRDKRELEEIERSNYLEEFSCSLPGRQSGSKEWRISRAELGADDNINMSSKRSSCPFRICIDDHVGKIYKSFGVILSHCIDHVNIPRVMDELKALQNFLLQLSATPFRTRKITIDSKSDMLALSEVLKSDAYQSLFQSLSLKSCVDETGRCFVGLGGEPVMTSLALPVGLDILKEILNNAVYEKNLTDNPAVKVFVNCTRVCSGSVQASGEQEPFGIATAAFDGLKSTKWEEPDGAKGSWIIYKLPDDSMQKLAAYQLTSANDAQERDPKDWVLEGSNDGGQTWAVLDSQKSQFFEMRFMRKTFIITREKQMCNSFRFRFLSVRDTNATTRLQVSCIDLYAEQDKNIVNNSS